MKTAPIVPARVDFSGALPHAPEFGDLYHAPLRAFQQGDALFQHLDRGVLKARIGHALLLAGKARRSVLRPVVAVSAGQEQRLGRLAIFGPGAPAPHSKGRGTPGPGDFGILPALALHDFILS